jgi:hypothetical protein
MSTTTMAMPATTTLADPSKLQKIINNSGVDIVVSLPLSAGESASANSTVSSNGDVELLSVTKGGNTIKAADNDTVLLDRTYKDPDTGETAYEEGYDLLIGTPEWMVPIANIGVIHDYDDDDVSKTWFDDVTVTADQKTALDQTVAFYQIIAAYPDSQFAKNYIAAMNVTSDDAENAADGSAGSAAAIQQKIAAGVATFFAGTANYKKVTLPDIVFLESYYNSFPFVWALYSASVTYYLYSSDGTATSFLGALSLTKPGTIDISKPNGGYACSFVPAVTPTDTTKTDVNQANAKTLTYSDGLFVDDTTADIPGVALKGSFQLKRTFSKDPNDTKIIVVISGTINGQTCIGFDQAQATKADDTTEDWLDSLFHPKTAAEIFNSVMTVLGALMMLHFVGSTLHGIVKWCRQKAAAKEPVQKADLDAKKATTESDLKSRFSERLKKMTGNKETLPDSADDGLAQAATEKGTLGDLVSSGQAQSRLIEMKDNLKVNEAYVLDDSTGTLQARINELAPEIRTQMSELTSEVADLRATLAELRPQLEDLSARVTKLNTDTQAIVAQDQKAAVEENVQNMEQVQEAIENEKVTTENEADDVNKTEPDADPLPDVDIAA